jgi:DNA repair photolyase
MTEKSKTGTREWSEASLNAGIGCHYDCRYCYAAANAVRHKQISSRSEWTTERIRVSKPSVRKDAHVIMSPTTHDLSDLYFDFLRPVWLRLLEEGKELLIVSKMTHALAWRLERLFEGTHKGQVRFRITIGTMDEEAAKWWEPGAPRPFERIEALKALYYSGFATSVSMEPLLGGVDTARSVLAAVLPFVTESVWIGPMNNIQARVENWSEHPRAVELRNIQTPAWARESMMADLQHQLIKWKDSMRKLAEEKLPGSVGYDWANYHRNKDRCHD